jgi:hypothetical protein
VANSWMPGSEFFLSSSNASGEKGQVRGDPGLGAVPTFQLGGVDVWLHAQPHSPTIVKSFPFFVGPPTQGPLFC